MSNLDKILKTQIGGNHYKNQEIQPAKLWLKNDLRGCEAAAIKYIMRWRNKDGIKDLEKAIHFLHMIIAHEHDKKHEEYKPTYYYNDEGDSKVNFDYDNSCLGRSDGSLIKDNMQDLPSIANENRPSPDNTAQLYRFCNLNFVSYIKTNHSDKILEINFNSKIVTEEDIKYKNLLFEYLTFLVQYDWTFRSWLSSFKHIKLIYDKGDLPVYYPIGSFLFKHPTL